MFQHASVGEQNLVTEDLNTVREMKEALTSEEMERYSFIFSGKRIIFFSFVDSIL